MTTYHIAARPRLSPGKRVLNQLARTGFFLLLYTAVWRVAEGRWLHLTILAILGTVLFLGNLLTTFLWEKKTPTYDVEIDPADLESQSGTNGAKKPYTLRPRVGRRC